MNCATCGTTAFPQHFLLPIPAALHRRTLHKVCKMFRCFQTLLAQTKYRILYIQRPFLSARRYTPLQKYASYIYTLIYLKVQRQKMGEKFQLKRCISKLNFGYNAKTVVYANTSSDIAKLYAIVSKSLYVGKSTKI